MEEIAKGIGYQSAGTVHKLFVEPLIEEGWLKRIHVGSRSIAPAKPETFWPAAAPQPPNRKGTGQPGVPNSSVENGNRTARDRARRWAKRGR